MKFIVDEIEIKQNEIYSSKIFEKKKPIVTSNERKLSNLYCTIIVDPDAPYPSEPKYKYNLHLMVINSSETKVTYSPPNPPADSPPHRYIVLLYKQPKYISIPNVIEKRHNFDLDNFVQTNELELVDQFKFMAKKD